MTSISSLTTGNRDCYAGGWLPTVDIKFISTLTSEDENAIAPIALQAIASILDLFPIAYSIQINTSDAHVYQHIRAQPGGHPAGSDSRMLKVRPSSAAHRD